MEQTATELKKQDQGEINELKYVLRKARERLGVSTRNKAFAGGGDVETLQKKGKAFDDVAAELAESYPHILGNEDPAQQLFELLGAGLPDYKTDTELWDEALSLHDRAKGSTGQPARGKKKEFTFEDIPD